MSNPNKFKWFGNDETGFTVLEFLTVFITFFYMVFKVMTVFVIINVADNELLVANILMLEESVSNLMSIVISYYFIKTGILDAGIFKGLLSRK